MFTVACFAENFFWSICVVGGDNFCSTFITFSFMEFTRIPDIHPLLMPHIWTLGGQRNAIFNVKCEFLFYDFEWFFSYLTL